MRAHLKADRRRNHGFFRESRTVILYHCRPNSCLTVLGKGEKKTKKHVADHIILSSKKRKKAQHADPELRKKVNYW